jgi:hypothetical protein
MKPLEEAGRRRSFAGQHIHRPIVLLLLHGGGLPLRPGIAFSCHSLLRVGKEWASAQEDGIDLQARLDEESARKSQEQRVKLIDRYRRKRNDDIDH